MIKKMLWAMVGFFFVVSAGTQLFIFTRLLLEQEVSLFDHSPFINRLEFAYALVIALIALSVFVYLFFRVIKTK